MSQIFISYSRKDQKTAKRIIDSLAQYDLEPWVDWLSIPKGEEFESEIKQGIEKAEIFLFLVSPDSIKSKWCQIEIDHAVKNGKRILPIVIRNVSPESTHAEISKRNWIFCRDVEDDFNKAITKTYETIHTDFQWIRYHTRLQIKALEWKRTEDKSRLLRGKELREAEDNLTEIERDKEPQPTDLQRRFVLSSQRNEKEQRRRVIIGLGLGLLE